MARPSDPIEPVTSHKPEEVDREAIVGKMVVSHARRLHEINKRAVNLLLLLEESAVLRYHHRSRDMLTELRAIEKESRLDPTLQRLVEFLSDDAAEG